MSQHWMLTGLLPAGGRSADVNAGPVHLRLEEAGLVGLLTHHRRPLEECDPPSLRQAALAHHTLLARHAEVGTVLPVRFGTMLPCAGAVRGLLVLRREAFLAALEALSGRDEYVVTLSRQADDPARPYHAVSPVAASGRGYLKARLADRLAARRHEASEAEAAHLVADAVWTLADNVRCDAGRADRLRVLSCLVPRPRVPVLAERVERLANSLAGFRLEITGPWPPYSFADGAWFAQPSEPAP